MCVCVTACVCKRAYSCMRDTIDTSREREGGRERERERERERKRDEYITHPGEQNPKKSCHAFRNKKILPKKNREHKNSSSSQPSIDFKRKMLRHLRQQFLRKGINF